MPVGANKFLKNTLLGANNGLCLKNNFKKNINKNLNYVDKYLK